MEKLTPKAYIVGPKKIQEITEINPPQNLQELQNYIGLVNYLNSFSPRLAELTV